MPRTNIGIFIRYFESIPRCNKGKVQFAAILSRFVAGCQEKGGLRKGRDEGLNLEGRGRVRREVTCMLDMCDPHDFCYRETRQASCHTYTLIFGDPEAYIYTHQRERSIGGRRSSQCWSVTYATHECRVDSYWWARSSYRWGRGTFGYQFCVRDWIIKSV